MPRKLFKRILPSSPKRHSNISFLQTINEDPNLLKINRQSICRGFVVGISVSMIPLPIHLLITPFIAYKCKANLPLSMILLIISNPLTFPLIVLLELYIGNLLLSLTPWYEPVIFEWQSLKHNLLGLWLPLLIGCSIWTSFCGISAWYLSNLGWRLAIRSAWTERSQRRDSHR